MRIEKPMIFLRQRNVKAVAAEQTSVGRNLRSISEQAISLSKQKGGHRGLSFGKKVEGATVGGNGIAGQGGEKGRDGRESLIDLCRWPSVERRCFSGNRIDNFTSFLDYRIRGSPRIVRSNQSHRHRIAFLPPSKNFSKIANSISQLLPQDRVLQMEISEYLIAIGATERIFVEIITLHSSLFTHTASSSFKVVVLVYFKGTSKLIFFYIF